MANVDLYLQSSTKRILSLVKTLPDGAHFADRLQAPSKPNPKDPSRRRFTRHPRLLASKTGSQISNDSLPDASMASLVVLKKPADRMTLTDSSDEFCDVTIRKDPLEPLDSDENDISDKLLETVQNRLALKNKLKMETKDIKNAVNSQKDCVKGDCTGDSKVVKCNKEKRERLRKSDGDVGGGDRKWAEKNERVEKVDRVERVKEVPKIFMNLKLRSMIDKSLTTLDDIRVLMEYGVDPPDGSEDYARRKKRAIEFATRFSRIHLYQLNRHITDIQNILMPTSDRSGPKSNVLDLNHKFYTAHQTIFQGFQAYKKHLPSTVIIGVPDKFGEFLKSTSSLCDTFRNNCDENTSGKEDDNIIDLLEMKCNVMYEDMQERRLMATPALKNGESKISINGNSYMKSLKSKSKASRYSMYQTIPKDTYWKKAIAALATKKFNVSSKYKTATYKHRPQPVQQRNFETHEVFKSPKNGSRKKSASKTINDMDRNVETQLQLQQEDEDETEAVSCGENHAMWNIAQEIFEKIGKEQTMSQKEYECILEHFISMVKRDKTDTKAGVHIEDEAQQLLEERLGKPLEKMEFKEFTDKLIDCLNGDENRKPPPEPETKAEAGEGNGKGASDANLCSKSGTGIKERRQTISVTGLKNAQLICIKDDSSFVEAAEEDAKKASANDVAHKEKSLEEKAPSKGKLVRLQKSKQHLKQLEMLPKEMMVDIIQYKLQFHKETKNNYMYKKSGNMSPWILMERIADKLMEESLFAIARDIQVDEILQKVLSQEFK